MLHLLSAAAQSGRIAGTVADADGNPLPGAAVVVSGTSQGTIVDNKGQFTLSAAEGQTLVVTFLGFKEKRVEVGTQTSFRIILEADENLPRRRSRGGIRHAEEGQPDRFRIVHLHERARPQADHAAVDRPSGHRSGRDRHHGRRRTRRRLRKYPDPRHRHVRRFGLLAPRADRRRGGQPQLGGRFADRPDLRAQGCRLGGHLRKPCGQRRDPRHHQTRGERQVRRHLPRLRGLADSRGLSGRGRRRGVHAPFAQGLGERRRRLALHRRIYRQLPPEQLPRPGRLPHHRLAEAADDRQRLHPQPHPEHERRQRPDPGDDLAGLSRPERHHQKFRFQAVQLAQQHGRPGERTARFPARHRRHLHPQGRQSLPEKRLRIHELQRPADARPMVRRQLRPPSPEARSIPCP